MLQSTANSELEEMGMGFDEDGERGGMLKRRRRLVFQVRRCSQAKIRKPVSFRVKVNP